MEKKIIYRGGAPRAPARWPSASPGPATDRDGSFRPGAAAPVLAPAPSVWRRDVKIVSLNEQPSSAATTRAPTAIGGGKRCPSSSRRPAPRSERRIARHEAAAAARRGPASATRALF